MTGGPTTKAGAGGFDRRVVVIAAIAAVIIVVAGTVLSMPAPVRQPIEFNHFLHIDGVGAECTDCHPYAESGIRATIPTAAVCADCHDTTLTDSEAEAWLVEQVQAGEPIPWRKLTVMPEHVFFSHRRHTAVGEVECATCHGPMEQRATPAPRPLVELTMDGCMQCHDEQGVSNDCIACHR